MKKKFIWLFALAFVCSVGALAACGGNSDPEEETQITMSRTELTLDVLERYDLVAALADSEGNAVSGDITWTSSDEAVATVQNGLVTALAAGTTEITAASGELSAACTVKVEANGIMPQLIATPSEIDIKAGETTSISHYVRFKSSTLDNSDYNITYSFSVGDDSVASVTQDGKLTAIKYGTTTVTVKASWAQATAAGLDANLTQTISVNVQPSYTLTAAVADGYSSTIYLQDATDGDVSYYSYTQLTVTSAVYNGQEITSGLVYKSSDENVVTVDSDGKVTISANASADDTADVWVEYVTASEGTIASEKITISVKKAIVTYTPASEVIADVSAAFALPVSDMFGSADAVIVKVYDAEDGTKTNLYNASEGTYAEVSSLGERTWIVEGEKIAYQLDVLAVSKIITTADEFSMFNDASASTTAAFPGYYILGNNIDLSGTSQFSNKGYPSGDGMGLTGTLDGRGYTVNGLSLGSGGLFGVISTTGSLVNIAFTNVTINAGTNGMGLMFGWYCFGSMENVYVGITEYSTQGTSSSSSLGMFALCNDATALKRIVVVISADAEYTTSVAERESYSSLEATSNKGAWQYTFVVSATRLFGGSSTNGDTGNNYVKSVARFESMAELLASDYYSEYKSKLSTSYWNRNTMSFKSSSEYLKAEFDSIPDTLTIAAGNTVALTANANAFSLVLSESAVNNGIEINNGKITATEFTSADDLTLTVTFGSNTKTVAISVNNSITVDYSYVYNLSSGDDFTITGSFSGATSATVSVSGTDGNTITLNATISGDTLTISKDQFSSQTYMPSGEVAMTATVDGQTVGINGVTLIYAITTADEYMSMANHLVESSSSQYDGNISIAADLDFTGKAFNSATDYSLYRGTFLGVLDGNYHVLSNISMTGSQSGAVCGTLNGTVQNLVIKNASVSTYGGVICYQNYGTIQNCYVKGSIISDGLSSSSNPDNFGTGLIAGRNRNGSKVVNCIAELVSKADTLYGAAAFGKLGDGYATESAIFENCYAVAASGFALMTYGSSRTLKDFTESNGNNNFADIYALLADATAGALAAQMGITAPVISSITISTDTLSVNVNNTSALTATATTADGEIIPVAFTWTSSADGVATVSGGTVTGVSEGTATITVSYGSLSATCAVTVSALSLETLVLSDFTYAYNGTTDFVITGTFPEATTVTARITGLDNNYIELSGITVSGSTLTIPAAQFNVDNMPTKTVTMSLFFDGSEMPVEGVYLIYTVNSATELAGMTAHLTSDYDGHIILGSDITDEVSLAYGWALRSQTFIGIFDGNYKHISSLVNSGAGVGLLGNLGTAGIIRNVIVDSATVSSYAGVLCYQCYGTIQNCYVKGSITSDGLSASSAPDNFGAGLIAGRFMSGCKVDSCIVELVSKGDTLYAAAAFGKLGQSGATEAAIFTNCYAVNASNFAIMTYGSSRATADFDETNSNGNKNFDSVTALLADTTAAALAQTFGITDSANE